MVYREIQQKIEEKLFKGKIIIITGARQVGKTTLVKSIAEKHSKDYLYLNCDEADVREILTETTSARLKTFIGMKKLVVIGEAQRIKNIGITLKLFADELKQYQVIATGSSALELSNEVNEPLTGRKFEFRLYPFSMRELSGELGVLETNRLLEDRIVYGMYPEIVLNVDERLTLLKGLASDYLFKDVLAYQNIKKPEVLEKLLIALAAQIGSEVSYNELSNTLKIEIPTIEKYINLLEKAYVIFKLPPFSRNVRTEITKMRKIYFYDTGIRNALVSNFNLLYKRQDAGALWENFLIAERIKLNSFLGESVKHYFWRTFQQQEIDYVEEESGNLYAYEFKWNVHKNKKIPRTFLNAYPGAKTNIIDKNNYFEFLNIA